MRITFLWLYFHTQDFVTYFSLLKNTIFSIHENIILLAKLLLAHFKQSFDPLLSEFRPNLSLSDQKLFPIDKLTF